MKFAIAVYGSPYSSQGAYSAYRFTQTSLAKGHQIERIFFYHDGVYNGTNLSVTPQDELNLCQCWQALNQQHHVELILCVSSAIKRGILNPAEATRYDLKASNLLDGFEISGLGQWVEAMVHCDRLICFGS